MTKIVSVLGLALISASMPAMSIAAAPVGASATLIRGDGTEVGHATFTQKKDGVWLDVTVSGLTPGTHGLHLHATGTCTGPDFASAGGHWNPMHMKHGTQAEGGAHMGDLPNIDVDAAGKGHAAALVGMATLDGTAMGMLDADGTALVIHAGPDDYKTDPSGNSGARIACGIVKAD